MFQHPLTERYNDPYLALVWSDRSKCRLWVKYWLTQLWLLPEWQRVSKDRQAKIVEMAWSPVKVGSWMETEAAWKEKEKELGHDVVAFLSVWTEDLPEEAVRMLHCGLTSSDPEDFADTQRILDSMRHTIRLLCKLLVNLAEIVRATASIPIMGKTHLQLAEPTTFGYRLATHLEQLRLSTQACIESLDNFDTDKSWKAWPGAVGTKANLEMVGTTHYLGGGMLHASGQTYPRSLDLLFLMPLLPLSAVLHKLALDFRLMYTEGWFLPPVVAKVGSSAMPGKTNPIGWEKVCSLTRLIPSKLQDLWHVAAEQALERTLDDSAARRMLLPELFLLLAESIKTATKQLPANHQYVNQHWASVQIAEGQRTWLASRALAYNQHFQPPYSFIRRQEEWYRVEEAFANLADDPLLIYEKLTGNHDVDALKTLLFLSKARDSAGTVAIAALALTNGESAKSATIEGQNYEDAD